MTDFNFILSKKTSNNLLYKFYKFIVIKLTNLLFHFHKDPGHTVIALY